MIAEFDGKLNRIQVKTVNEESNGAIICYCRSSKNHTTNKLLSNYVNEVDYFVFYNQTYDLIALVPMDEIGDKTTISLRITPPANGQTKGVRYFADYGFENYFISP